ncbi:MAG: DUF5050 domain-containing protein, partial [Clostridia bacterium]|nr:DUF5050 domain-containing protein [Clostridia bacterium]
QVASWLRGKEQSETDALHAKGLFSRQETALIAEQLVTQTLQPEWLTNGDFRSAAGIFKLFGVSGTRYGEDYPAVFLEMIHESAGGYAIYPYDLKRLAVEFAGVPEAKFHVDDYLDNVTGYDPVNAEVYVVPTEGPSPRYEPENLTVEVRENGTAARFALYKVEYSMGYPRELLEKTCLGDWEISFTAQGDGMLPRMRFGKAEVQKVSYSPVFTGLNGRTFSPFTVDLPSSWQELVTANMRDGTYPMVSFYTGDGSSPENAWEYLFTWLVTTNEISWDGTELQSWLLGDDICTFADASGRYYSMQFALMSGNEKHWTTADGDAQSVIAEYGEVLASLRPNEGYRIIHAEPGSPVLWQWDNYVNAAAAFEPIVERARIELPAALASDSGYALIPAVSFSTPKSSLWADGVQILSSMKTDESGAMVLDFCFADSGFLFFSIRTEIIPWQEAAGPIRLLPYERHLRTCEVNVNGTIHWCRVTASFFDDEERRLITAPGGRSRPFTRLPDEVQIRLMLEAEAVLASVSPAESSPSANRGTIPGNLMHGGHIAQDTQGRIYFEDRQDRTLWRVNADGSDPVLLTSDHALYVNVLGGWVTYVRNWDTIRRVPADGGDPVTLWEAPSDSPFSPHISCLFVTPDAIWFGARIDAIDRVYRMNTDGSDIEMILTGYTLEGVDGGKLFVSEHTKPSTQGLYQIDIANLGGEFPVLEQIWEGFLYSAVIDEYGIAILVSPLERIVVLDRETFAEIYSTRYTYVDYLWAYGKLSLYGYTGEHGDQWVIRQTDVSTGVTRDILTLGEEIFDNAGRTFGITFYDYYRSPEGEAVREAFAADHPELADQNGEVWPLTEQPMELQAVGGEVWCLARSVKALRETGLSDNWLICDGADGTVAQLGRSLSSDILASVPVVLPPVNAISSATSLDELPNLGLDGSDMRLAYIRALVTGDIDALEQVCGVEKGMYADYRTLELSSWAVWFNAGEDGGPLRFAFVPTQSDVEAFPINVRTEGTLNVGLMGAYFSRPDSSSSFGEAAEALYELLSRHLLLDLPTTDDMDSPTRFDLSCYICLKLGNEDLTEENIAEYARKHFGIENFTPDGGHVGIHGHGGSHQVLEIVGSEEIAGETAVTVQYYADLSKTLKSHTYRYTMKRIDDGWAFTGSEEIAHAEYEPVRWSV